MKKRMGWNDHRRNMTARLAVVYSYIDRRYKNRFLEVFLAKHTKFLRPRDAALAMRIAYGTIQHQDLIDLGLAEFYNKKASHPTVLDILRISAYQLWFLDKIPRHAIVDEAVIIAKKFAPFAAGMVNAVLRRLPDEPPETDDLAIKYSIPRWLHDRLLEILPPDELEPFYMASNKIPPVYIKGNPLKKCRKNYELAGGPGGNIGNLENILASGRGIVADPGAQRVVEILSPLPGSRVWDCCAAPGGKTAMLAMAMENKGYILSSDAVEDKIHKITDTIQNIGTDIVEVKNEDATLYQPDEPFDYILADVPCSGFGVLRKKPDIRFRTEISHLPDLQLAILENVSKSLKTGGELLYSTCTLLPEENEGVVNKFIENNSDFTIEHTETLWPHKGDTDGFFICLMKKQTS